MKWKKHGLVWAPGGDQWWARTHATCPTPHLRRDGTLRLYIQSRDDKGVGRVGYVDVEAKNPLNVLGHSPEPVLSQGKAGCFDDNGVMATCVVRGRDPNTLLMYYVGFELCHHIRYRLFTGVAISRDDGDTFNRIQKTPLLDRTDSELFFRCGTHVFTMEDSYRMYYIAGSEWMKVRGKDMPLYDLRSMVSQNGLDWEPSPDVLFPLDPRVEHGFGRPFVISLNDNYYMFYSIRTIDDGYRLGLATSRDCRTWVRIDEELNLSPEPQGWDSKSMEYAAPFWDGEKWWCFYNGNNFGEDGFGLAELVI